MKRVISFAIIILIALAALTRAQDAPQSKASDKPIEAKPAEKPKPIILDATKLRELEILSLRLQLAQAKAENAIPSDLKEAVKVADVAVAEFWKALGVPREELTGYTVSDGMDGAKILTRKPAPKAEAKP